MELFAEMLSIVGALLLSVSCGVLVEELFFGGLVRLMAARQPAARQPAARRIPRQSRLENEGEPPCFR